MVIPLLANQDLTSMLHRPKLVSKGATIRMSRHAFEKSSRGDVSGLEYKVVDDESPLEFTSNKCRANSNCKPLQQHILRIYSRGFIEMYNSNKLNGDNRRRHENANHTLACKINTLEIHFQ